MKNKGFTLIELLAVIVILAIIALIAVPIILNIINDTKKESDKRSKELYLDAVNQAIARKNLVTEFNPTSCTVNKDGNLTCDDEELIVEVEGLKPCGGNITLDNGIVKEETVKFTCEPPSFANDDWATIIENVRAGNTDAYNVGDTKEVTLTGDSINGTYTVRIANKTDKTEGCGGEDFSETACGFVIEFVDIITTHNMNSDSTNVGGWPKSELYSYLTTTIYNALPEEIKAGIKETKVISGHGSGDTSGTATNNNFETTDKLYLLSPHEVWENGSLNTISNDTAWDKTRQLDYYKEKGVATDANLKIAIKNYQNSASYWWLRSAVSDSTRTFYFVYIYGDWHTNSATATIGVAPAFRIG